MDLRHHLASPYLQHQHHHQTLYIISTQTYSDFSIKFLSALHIVNHLPHTIHLLRILSFLLNHILSYLLHPHLHPTLLQLPIHNLPPNLIRHLHLTHIILLPIFRHHHHSLPLLDGFTVDIPTIRI